MKKMKMMKIPKIKYVNMVDCSYFEKISVAWFDDRTKEIVVIKDHPYFLKNKKKVISHEIAHYNIDRRIPNFLRWPIIRNLFILVEEPFIHFYYQKKFIKKKK